MSTNPSSQETQRYNLGPEAYVQKAIGGPFNLEVSSGNGATYHSGHAWERGVNFATPSYRRFNLASAALAAYIHGNMHGRRPIRRINIPSYTCPDVYRAIKDIIEGTGMEEVISVRTYHSTPIDRSLRTCARLAAVTGKLDSKRKYSDSAADAMNFCDPSSPQFKADPMGPADLLIFNDYFGFTAGPVLPLVRHAQKHTGMHVIHDLSQAVFNGPESSDLKFTRLYSPRKFYGILDGGIICRSEPSDDFRLPMEPSLMYVGANVKWFSTALRASMAYEPAEVRYQVLKAADKYIPRNATSPAPISQFSWFLLEGMTSHRLNEIQLKRQQNYDHLLIRLRPYNFPLYDNRSTNVTPLGFPVLVPNRDDVLTHLYTRRIYPMVHWKLFQEDEEGYTPWVVVENESIVKDISHHIMTLPCDQRYDTADMDRIADELISVADKVDM